MTQKLRHNEINSHKCEFKISILDLFRGFTLSVITLFLTFTLFQNSVLVSLGQRGRIAAIILLIAILAYKKPVSYSIPHPILPIFILASGYLVLSTAWSIAPRATISSSLSWCLLVLTAVLIASRVWICFHRFTNDFAFIFIVLMGVHLTSYIYGSTDSSTRFAGLFKNSNSYALVSVMTFAIGMLLLQATKSKRIKFIILLTLFTLFYGILISDSRIALSACIVVVIWSLAANLNLKVSIIVLILTSFLAIAISIFPNLFLHINIISRFQSSSESEFLNGRDIAWHYGISLWAQTPYLGVGFRAGEEAFSANRGAPGSFEFDGAHNSYLQLLLECGAIGAILFSVIWFLFFRLMFSYRRNRQLLGLTFICLAGFVSGISESALFGMGQVFAWIFWISLFSFIILAKYYDRSISQTPEFPRSSHNIYSDI